MRSGWLIRLGAFRGHQPGPRRLWNILDELRRDWHAHALNAPGNFLIAAAEHATPKRARAYLITDQAVADTAERFADLRPPFG